MAKSEATEHSQAEALGDFTATPRMALISVIAVAIGLISTGVAWVLLRLIGFFTNLLYYGRIEFRMVSPANNQLGWLAVLIPVAGGIVVGLMARYGSERIRGHGIPEALESILLNGSKVQPRLAILKPVSSAIAIGSGGPFGAEGPIIMTGGAIGSIIAQLFRLSSVERKTLLVAGAAAGMSATFAAPVASMLLAIELLLFEFKPRSAVPVALAAATAGAARRYLLGLGPLFPVPQHSVLLGPSGLAGCVLAGILAGLLSIGLTKGMYAMEDLFHKLPVHWMWWPAIGGVVVGLGGLIFPQALGVGYDTIGAMLQGDVPTAVIAGVLIVKSTIWIVALGSGTSGGVLAPLLMMGAALGGIEGMFLPHYGGGFWPLVSMAAVLAGAMGAPLTGIVFALELTHDISVLLPLLIAGMMSYAISVLVLKRSILTEKIARRGYHLSREYSIDPLEILFAREVMRTNVVAVPAVATAEELRRLALKAQPGRQYLFPVVDDDRKLRGVLTRNELQKFVASGSSQPVGSIVRKALAAYGDEPLRSVVMRMAETGITRMPVLDSSGKLQGMVSLRDLLRARVRNLEEERRRERILRLRVPFVLPRQTDPNALPSPLRES
jgi:CIC family chloride channel protein